MYDSVSSIPSSLSLSWPRPAAPSPSSAATSAEDESEERLDLLPYVSFASIGGGGKRRGSRRRPLKAVPHSLSGSVVRRRIFVKNLKILCQ